VAEFRGQETEPEPEVRIELPVEAHIPTDYVESERLRLEMYKRLAEVRNDDDLKAVEEELLDRYGPLPVEVQTLLEVARFRVLARSAGLSEIVTQGNFVRFGPAELLESRTLRLKRLYPGSVVKDVAKMILVPRPKGATFGAPPPKDLELLGWCSDVVRAVFQTG